MVHAVEKEKEEGGVDSTNGRPAFLDKISTKLAEARPRPRLSLSDVKQPIADL